MLTVAQLQRSAKLAWFLNEIDKNCNEYLPDVSSEIQKLINTVYEECYIGMVEAVNQAHDLSALRVRPEVMKSAIANNIEKLTLPALLEKNRKEIVYEIKQTVSIGLMNGERYETMSRKLVDRLDFSYGKANNVVRTETHRNIEAGLMDGAAETQKALLGSGLVHTAIWRTMEDERVRPQRRYHTKTGWKTKTAGKANHMKMEGVAIIVGDKFKLEPNVYAPCPGMSGTARNDCNCRCFLEYDLLTLDEWAALPNKQENFLSAKSLDKSGESGIIGVRSDKVTISAIEQPIEQQHTGKGNPNAILTFDAPLNSRQQKLLEQLSEFDSKIIVPKKSVNMADLSALTAKTGDEFAMFTKGGERLIIRGNNVMVNIGKEDAQELAEQGYKWSGHTHPGVDENCLLPSGGDKGILQCFNQEISVIYNSKGNRQTFEKE
ncbi:MAG: phage head morphogenesis protein [Prevotella sp.]|nr:phage head morphogenesis protein [Prevotella sp.]